MLERLRYWLDLLSWSAATALTGGILAWAAWDGYRRLRTGDPSFLWSLAGVGASGVLLWRGFRFRPVWDCDCPRCTGGVR